MYNTDFTRIALSAVGALIFSMTAISAAVGPARVVETTPLVYAGAAPVEAGTANA